MKDLRGNGQAGRMEKAERAIAAQQKLIWIAMGGLAVLQFLSANGWLKVH